MKLYLSSYHLGNNPEELVDLVSGSRKAYVIPNALDFSDDLERKKAGILRETNDLNSLGLDAAVLDLRDFFGKIGDLRDYIREAGLVWVIGGNSFVLRRAMRQSGLDIILRDMRGQDGFVYAGYSAGSCVATPTLHGIELVDDPHGVPKGYDKAIIWEGLSLVPYSIAPHYRSDHPETEAINNVVNYFIENKMNFKALHDGDVIIDEV